MPSPASTDPPAGPHASATRAYVDGWRRVSGAPALVLGLVAAGLFAFAPAPGLGGPTADLLPRQLDGIWLAVHEALGIGIGPAGPVPLLDGILDPAATSAALLYLGWSTVLWGGVLDRLARRRRIGTGPFWSACGVYGVRLARMAFVVLPIYAAIFAWLFPAILWLAGRIGGGRDGLFLLGVSLATLLPVLALVGLLVEFARVRLVVEDRQSALGSLAAAARFIGRRPVRAIGLYAIQLIVAWFLVTSWVALAVDPGTVAGWALALGWLIVRVAARLASAAAAVSFFQSELAHAGYAAAPMPMWPDSPTVEGLRNLRL